MRILRPALLAAGLLLGTGARDASAQTSADSLALARAVADMVVAGQANEPAVMVLPPVTRFDSLVARALQASALFQRPVADSAHALKVGTHAAVIRGDMAEVTLETMQCEPDGDELNWWASHHSYSFRLAEGTWRQAGPGREVGNRDGHCGPEVGRRSMSVTKDGA